MVLIHMTIYYIDSMGMAFRFPEIVLVHLKTTAVPMLWCINSEHIDLNKFNITQCAH